MNKLQGKVALVTGGNSGIGLATAQLFAQEGAQVIITGRDQATLDEAARLVGPGTLAVRSDVSQLAELDQLFAQINTQFGGLDVVFANAGIFKGGALQDSTEALYAETFDINVKGVFFTIQKAEPLLRDGAAVVINASTVIHAGMPGASLYAASKAAVRQLARNLSNELAGRNIRVNVVSPGYTRTPIIGRAGYDDEQVEGFYGHASGEVPLRRAGRPEEIAKAVLFLASDDSSYVVGEELLVDGGYGTVGAAGVARG
ncbi:SDR family oxidoreductase [Hymenobacter sp.]|uniref:SDR family oxidoreductase n=1 Tax=Hymenobacter sp. TaxID=1898978 RepID=UPI00286D4227|nr:SDR family oxidoreductase [Hymenobacter sp.]